jgi:hypothetical protein
MCVHATRTGRLALAREVVQVLDLAAKLNRETGHQADGRSGDTHFHIQTNINVMALRAAAHQAFSRRRPRFRSRLTA